MRLALVFMVAIAGVCQMASAATISGVLNPGYADGGNFFPGKIARINLSGTTDSYFGSVSAWTPPSFAVLTNASQAVDSGLAVIRTDVSQSGSPTGTLNFNMTTYSQFYTPGGNALSDEIRVYNSSYWEFTVNGIYNWSINDQAPETRGALNNRTYQFVKVVGNVETLVTPTSQNAVGTGSLTPSGVNLTSGTYRLRYEQLDRGPKDINASPRVENSTNLNISFSFVSEDNSGVVPEPSSVAVFGVLGLGSLLAKYRRKK